MDISDNVGVKTRLPETKRNESMTGVQTWHVPSGALDWFQQKSGYFLCICVQRSSEILYLAKTDLDVGRRRRTDIGQILAEV